LLSGSPAGTGSLDELFPARYGDVALPVTAGAGEPVSGCD
jgi:hypothetical protein